MLLILLTIVSRKNLYYIILELDIYLYFISLSHYMIYDIIIWTFNIYCKFFFQINPAKKVNGMVLFFKPPITTG